MTLSLLCDECGELRELADVTDPVAAERYLEADLDMHQLEEHGLPFVWLGAEAGA